MKKIAFILCLSCFCLFQSAFCQKDSVSKPHSDLHHELGIDAGPVSIAGLYNYVGAGVRNAIFNIGTIFMLGTLPMQLNIYGNYSLHYYYQVKLWCQVGFKAGVECAKATIFADEARTFISSIDRYTQITIMPSVRFTYLNRPWVRLYSGLDVGFACFLTNITDYYEIETGEKYTIGYPQVAFNVAVFGVNVGKKFYGLFELNAGFESMVKVGIGARF